MEFIDQKLPQIVERELKQGALSEQGDVRRALDEKTAEVRKFFGGDAIDADGNLLRGQDLDLGMEYLALRAKTKGARDTKSLEADVYNYLNTFFSRYYQDGDFIAKRRYSPG